MLTPGCRDPNRSGGTGVARSVVAIDPPGMPHYIQPAFRVVMRGSHMSSNSEPAPVAHSAGAREAKPNGGPSRNGPDLRILEARLDELIGICRQLRDENAALKTQQSNLLIERAHLIERSELARSRVEAMIARLKAMESGS
jgi:cell division protein ZapB